MTETINRLRFPGLRFPGPLVATLALLAILGALLLPATAQAQTSTTLVSNIDQGNTESRRTMGLDSQRFTTGAKAGGYILTAVDVVSTEDVSTSADPIGARVCGTDSSGDPTTDCTDLTVPVGYDDGDTISLTASPGIALMQDTTYTVVFKGHELSATPEDDEDSDGESDWSIANVLRWSTDDGITWDDHSQGLSILIDIKGYGDSDGVVTLSPTSPGLGVEITATLTDADGSVTGESWQWSSADSASGTFTDISGGTAEAYTTVAADIGKYLKATVSYTDGHGSGKSADATTGDAVSRRLPGSEFRLASANGNSVGIWSDGTTVWVADSSDGKLYAYALADGTRQDGTGSTTDMEFDLHSDNGSPRGIWSDDTTIWVADSSDDKLYAYALADGTRQDGTGVTTDMEFDLDSDNGDAKGIWSNGTTIWVANLDAFGGEVFAYALAGGTRQDGTGSTTDMEFDLHSDNGAPVGMWSDDTTIWVADSVSDQVYAYKMSDKSRDESKEFDFDSGNTDPWGIWSDYSTMWVVDAGEKDLFAYHLPTAATVDDVEVTSTPVLETDTYGAGERIEVSVTFSEAVNATSNTDFVLSIGRKQRMPLVDGSGTATLVFGYIVQADDEDDDGVFIGKEEVTLVGDRDGNAQAGEITSVATGEPVFIDHPSESQPNHKIDGSRSIVSVEVTSTPQLETDTYGAGETILFTVTFNVEVDAAGTPVLEFLFDGSEVRQAGLVSGDGTAELVFGYTVVSGDDDDNGLFLRDESDYNNPDARCGSIPAIRSGSRGPPTDAPLYWSGRGTQTGHKVDGSRSSVPAQPTNFTVAPDGSGKVTLSWDAPATDVTSHEFRYKTGNGAYPASYMPIANSGAGGANEDGFTVDSLTDEVEHTFELRAVNALGRERRGRVGPGDADVRHLRPHAAGAGRDRGRGLRRRRLQRGDGGGPRRGHFPAAQQQRHHGAQGERLRRPDGAGKLAACRQLH